MQGEYMVTLDVDTEVGLLNLRQHFFIAATCKLRQLNRQALVTELFYRCPNLLRALRHRIRGRMQHPDDAIFRRG